MKSGSQIDQSSKTNKLSFFHKNCSKLNELWMGLKENNFFLHKWDHIMNHNFLKKKNIIFYILDGSIGCNQLNKFSVVYYYSKCQKKV